MSDAASVSIGSSGGGPSQPDEAVKAYYRDIAPFYDVELASRDDLELWRALAAEWPGSRTLELGAGSGAVTAQLASTAEFVVGIDISDDLLQLGRQRLARWPHVRLVRADMRALPFDRSVGEAFDLIVAANDPLSHLTEDADRDAVLRGVAHLLAPAGRFVLDALWLPADDAKAVLVPGGRVQEHDAVANGQSLHVVERWQRDPYHRRCCHARYEYHRPGHRPVVASFEARDWTPLELSERLERAGLTVTDWWGSFQRDPWDPSTSQHLIVAARRAS